MAAGVHGLRRSPVVLSGAIKEGALKAIQDAAEAYLDDMIEVGEQVPPKEGVTVVDAPAITITRGV